MDCLCRKSYGPIIVFFRAFCSWRSFSIALPVQALRRLPCLGSLSVVWCIRHIEAPPSPNLRSYSVDRYISHLKEYPGWCPTLWFCASGIWWASLSTVQLLMAGVGRERLWWWPHPLCMTWQYCFRKADPFQGPKLGSCLTLGNELSEETHVLTKQEILLGKGNRVESSRVREPRRTALPRGLQSPVLWWWD